MTVGLAREFAPKVRVNTISPGMFATDISKHWVDTEAMKKAIPMKRFGEPEEIIGTALYLRSEEHTSELQSLMRISYAVLCLKKKTNTMHVHTKDKHAQNGKARQHQIAAAATGREER